MARPFSMDLRERVVDAVERGGLSRRQAAARFGVGVSTVIAWVARFRETGQRGARADGRAPAEEADRRAGGTGCWRAAGSGTSPCAGWWRSSPSAACRSTTARCGSSSTPRGSRIKKDADRGRAGAPGRRAPAGAVDEVPGPDRPVPPGVHRRDLDQDQHGAAPGLGAARRAAEGRGAARPLEDHDLPGGAAPRPGRGALAPRRPDRRRELPALRRAGPRADAPARRHRRHGQSRLAQGHGGAARHPRRRGAALLPAEVLARPEPDREALRQAQALAAQGRRPNPATPSATPSARSSTPSPQANAPTTSPRPDMHRPKLIPLCCDETETPDPATQSACARWAGRRRRPPRQARV